MRPPALSLVALLPAAALALLVAPAGCGNQVITEICHQTCDCSPCTRSDLDTCVTTGQTAETKAQTKKCSTQFDALLTCLDENLSCQQGAGPGTTKCTSQEAALTKCAGFGNPFTTPCQEAAQKAAACNGSTVQNPGVMCTGASACQSTCVLAQPCDVITGQMFDQSFQDCINQCSLLTSNTGSTGTGFQGGAGPK